MLKVVNVSSGTSNELEAAFNEIDTDGSGIQFCI